jgi:propanol-preferring alcohol dehydrogenase
LTALHAVEAAPLTDAGITTYSAIKPALPGIWPGSTAVVIGIAGWGCMPFNSFAS